MTDYEFIQIISDSRRTSEHERAFHDFYNKYEGVFVGYMRKCYKGDDDLIHEIYNDSCIALSDKIRIGNKKGKFDTSKYGEKISLKSYLLVVGRGKLIDKIRKHKYDVEFIDGLNYDLDADGQIPTSEDMDIYEERFAVVRHAVNAMKEPCNKILTLFYYDEMSGKEIADLCNYADEDSVKTQKYKCMNKLKTYIKNILK